jgi:hypothetical protein
MFVVDPWNYRLLLLIRGIEDEFDFYIVRQVGERLQRAVSDEKEDARPSFFYFESSDDQRIAVLIEDIEAIHYLFESGIPVTQQTDVPAEEDSDLYDVLIYFRTRAEPMQCVVEGREELDNIFEELEGEPDILSKFLSFTDEEGEVVTINTQHVVLFIVKKHDWPEEEE